MAVPVNGLASEFSVIADSVCCLLFDLVLLSDLFSCFRDRRFFLEEAMHFGRRVEKLYQV